MKYFSFFLVLAITIALAMLVSRPIGQIPPLAPLLDPNHGFWQNTLSEDQLAEEEINIENLSAPVEVVFDKNLIPHIFAQNELDLYRAQGYVTAQHRLWQMEFQTMAAAGRVSEIVGPIALELDRMTRRKGLAFGAEVGLKYIEENDPETLRLVEAYTDGVNQYISKLSDARLPVEYKILNYRPEPWSAYKSLLLLKYMSDMLVGDRDLEYSNLRKILGDSKLNKLFPDFPTENDPVIESEKVWDFTPIPVNKPDSVTYPDDALLLDPLSQPVEGTGSNNWAVAGKKTQNGNPILANDPHLSLNLPSLWFSMQLSTPTYTVKGATLPGALGVISGFNQDIAWGVTNATKDARDWYKITFQDESRKTYKFGDEWIATDFRIEAIKVKGQDTFIDTVVYTHHGPVVYDKSFRSERQDVNFALKWTVHMGSNEQRTFIQMNKAKDYADYNAALDFYASPAQNFVFASKSGDIGMRIQGKFPLKWEGQGKFFMDGADPKMEWQGFIPNAHNPATLNPERGFVSSANQHPVDRSYPYYVFDNSYEHYRNRHLNRKLREMNQITVEDMKMLQFDDYNLQAAEGLPVLIKLLGTHITESPDAEKYLNELKSWDYFADPNQKGQTLYAIWSAETFESIWREFMNGPPVARPNSYQTVELLNKSPKDSIFDVKSQEGIQTAEYHVKAGFDSMLVAMKKWEAEEGDYTWANFKKTTIQHLVPNFKSFSASNVYTGGGSGMLNATGSRHGASWRMVVELGPEIQAFGVYPGGQSGNPGSRFYANFIPIWANGEYLNFNLRSIENQEDVLFKTILK
ncbi:penicillin amidase [Algoriphagus alkaliphilus]|uniref:Penicillin amidase n=1 Tax=Algoriphagus alkaliphilus TaxID=279824 RepID=A0A1G5Y6V1_9BACT|nr:penicillin acylase family protein [Algoriphagus alkaliphilus]MBA4301669.1 penicillin acylase family protein [Cyclobacterium sp.]SDA78411.1 penicillin amidase [Algoriphagus alkaliphilus]